MKIAILYICTGEYSVFWEGFYKSFEKNFLPNCEKEYFVFTDSVSILKCKNVCTIKHEYMGWPYDTLMRFDIFLRIEEELEKFDYVFFFNANMICENLVTEEEFLNINKDINLILVKHPGVYNTKPRYLPYDRNPKSTAYIPYNKGEHYVMGALNGGKTSEYLKLIRTLKNNTDIDLHNNVIARVHDESHLNKYVLNRKDCFVLSPAYCNAEVYDLPFEKKIVMLDKEKYFNANKIKNINYNERYIKKFIRRCKKFIVCNIMYIIDCTNRR